MGSISTTYDPAKNLTFVRAEGGMTAHDFLRWGKTHRSRRVTASILWDLLCADLSGLSSDEIKLMASPTRGIAVVRKGGRIALVFGHAHDFGIGRMMEAYGEVAENASALRAFHTMAAAREWLGV